MVTPEDIQAASPDIKNPLKNDAHAGFGFDTDAMQEAVNKAQAKMNSDSAK